MTGSVDGPGPLFGTGPAHAPTKTTASSRRLRTSTSMQDDPAKAIGLW